MALRKTKKIEDAKPNEAVVDKPPEKVNLPPQPDPEPPPPPPPPPKPVKQVTMLPAGGAELRLEDGLVVTIDDTMLKGIYNQVRVRMSKN